MVITMRAAPFVSWGPLSAQDMGLVWLRHFMCSQKKEITHLFRKSLCIRMRISSLTSKLDSKRLEFWKVTTRYLSQPGIKVSSRTAAQHLRKLLDQLIGVIDFWMELTELAQRLLLLTPEVFRAP